MAESVNRKLERVRAPRVHIKYDVETGGAIEMKELPFVMGVLGDYAGQPVEEQARLKDRKFVEVTPDNFDDVLASMKPHLAYSVENKLSEDPDAPKLKVDLNFRSLDDFSPEAVATFNEWLARYGEVTLAHDDGPVADSMALSLMLLGTGDAQPNADEQQALLTWAQDVYTQAQPAN